MARRTLIINGVLAVALVVVGVVAYSWLHTSSKAAAARQTTTVTQAISPRPCRRAATSRAR